MIGKSLPEAVEDQFFRGAIRFGDEIEREAFAVLVEA